MRRAPEPTPVRYWGDVERDACGYANVYDSVGRRIKGVDWPNFDCDDGFVDLAPVGRYRENAFGLNDMLGNVWEWTEDCWHDTYRGAPNNGNAWTNGGDCSKRVMRGGSSFDYPGDVRAAHRSPRRSSNRDIRGGFRVAKTLP